LSPRRESEVHLGREKKLTFNGQPVKKKKRGVVREEERNSSDRGRTRKKAYLNTEELNPEREELYEKRGEGGNVIGIEISFRKKRKRTLSAAPVRAFGKGDCREKKNQNTVLLEKESRVLDYLLRGGKRFRITVEKTVIANREKRGGGKEGFLRWLPSACPEGWGVDLTSNLGGKREATVVVLQSKEASNRGEKPCFTGGLYSASKREKSSEKKRRKG